jgi:hypothetical protein
VSLQAATSPHWDSGLHRPSHLPRPPKRSSVGRSSSIWEFDTEPILSLPFPASLWSPTVHSGQPLILMCLHEPGPCNLIPSTHPATPNHTCWTSHGSHPWAFAHAFLSKTSSLPCFPIT